MHRIILSAIVILLSMSTSPMVAQTCSDVVTRALNKTVEVCSGQDPNYICYGNGLIESELQPDTILVFEDVGDIASIQDVVSVTHSALDEATEVWGVSLLTLQANIPNTLPGQLAQIIVFGSVEVTDVESNAFQFRSGIGMPTCTEAPPNGIMVRTPEGLAEVTLTINSVEISMGSTAFIQANADDGMTIKMLDGSAQVTALGETQTILEAQQTHIPLEQDDNDNLIPSQPPSQAESWDDVESSNLSVVYDTLLQIGEQTGTSSNELSADDGTDISSDDIIVIEEGQQWCLQQDYAPNECSTFVGLVYDATNQTINEVGAIYTYVGDNRYLWSRERERRTAEGVVTYQHETYLVVKSPRLIERYDLRTWLDPPDIGPIDIYTLDFDD